MVAHAEAAAALSLTPRLTPRPTVRADRASLAPRLAPRPPVASLSPRHQPLSPRHQQPAGAVPPTASTLSPRLAYVSRNSTPEITLVTPRDRSLATAAALESSAPFEFLRGEGAELLADELRAGGLAYLREEALCDLELRTRFPNPFCLIPVSTSQAPRLRRYLTASAQAVTLWLDGAACEVVPLDDWRRHFRSFARVAAVPPLYRCHRRRFFMGWRAAVRRARNARNAQALLRAFREAQAELAHPGPSPSPSPNPDPYPNPSPSPSPNR